MGLRCKIREMGGTRAGTRVKQMRHVGHKFKEALTLRIIKLQARDPKSQVFLHLCPVYLLALGGMVSGSLPALTLCEFVRSCSHGARREFLGDIWSEPRKIQVCRGFFGSCPISFLTPRHPLWKVPLAGCELSQLISWIVIMSVRTAGSAGEREPSARLQACPPHTSRASTSLPSSSVNSP